MSLEKQLELEREMIGMGVKRYTDSIHQNREKGMERKIFSPDSKQF